MEGKKSLRVLELFSGIGGMHFALRGARLESKGWDSDVVVALDINDLANQVYQHNFPKHKVLNKNIKGLTAQSVSKLDVNAILMSPPCQPFTRNGKFKDLEDSRTDPLTLICGLIPKLPKVEYILLENVVGFDKSMARKDFLQVLESSGFHYQEYILSPTQLGVPNTRTRYYCIARRKPFTDSGDSIITSLGSDTEEPETLEAYLNKDVSEEYLLSEKVLRTRFKVLDVVVRTSRNSMCFTKAYTHYQEGTGSIFCPQSEEMIARCFKTAYEAESDPEAALTELRLRYFTPDEVARLMKFPSDFDFPANVTNRQRYRLLGNSINVEVVSRLIQLLVDN